MAGRGPSNGTGRGRTGLRPVQRKRALYDRLEDLTKCSLCEKVFNEPHTLTCSHTFCHACIVAELEGPGFRDAVCPNCGRPAWMRDLKRNCTLNNIVPLATSLVREFRADAAAARERANRRRLLDVVPPPPLPEVTPAVTADAAATPVAPPAAANAPADPVAVPPSAALPHDNAAASSPTTTPESEPDDGITGAAPVYDPMLTPPRGIFAAWITGGCHGRPPSIVNSPDAADAAHAIAGLQACLDAVNTRLASAGVSPSEEGSPSPGGSQAMAMAAKAHEQGLLAPPLPSPQPLPSPPPPQPPLQPPAGNAAVPEVSPLLPAVKDGLFAETSMWELGGGGEEADGGEGQPQPQPRPPPPVAHGVNVDKATPPPPPRVTAGAAAAPRMSVPPRGAITPVPSGGGAGAGWPRAKGKGKGRYGEPPPLRQATLLEMARGPWPIAAAPTQPQSAVAVDGDAMWRLGSAAPAATAPLRERNAPPPSHAWPGFMPCPIPPRTIFLSRGIPKGVWAEQIAAAAVMGATLVNRLNVPTGAQKPSHMVVKVDDRTGYVLSRTVKYFLCLLRGMWVVNPRWLIDSAAAGRWVAEEGYEPGGDAVCADAPANARRRVAAGDAPLFDGDECYFVGTHTEAGLRSEWRELFHRSGLKLLANPPELEPPRRGPPSEAPSAPPSALPAGPQPLPAPCDATATPLVFLQSQQAESVVPVYAHWPRARVVSVWWVLDSISHGYRLPAKKFVRDRAVDREALMSS